MGVRVRHSSCNNNNNNNNKSFVREKMGFELVALIGCVMSSVNRCVMSSTDGICYIDQP